MTDPFVGKLAFFRVYSGTMNSGSYVLNATKDKKERVGRILQMHANKRHELDKVYSGDIAAAVGFKSTTTGDTICDEQHPVILESMVFPEPVIDIAIEPKTKAGQDKMGEALAKLAEEDPTFRVHTDTETGQTIISGMGELHLEIIVDRLLREFKVEANVGAPQVAYKETMTKAVDVDSKYAKQSGGRGQYGHCKVHFTPMDPNGEETFKFTSSVVGGAIPKEYIPAVGEGIEEATKAGILGGFPVLGVAADVYDGSYHEVDSSEMAFHIAGSMAFKDAMAKGNPVLLEPIMKVEVTMPEEYMATLSVTLTHVVDVSRVWKISAAARWLKHMFRLLRCSVTLQTFVPEHRDVVTTPCSSRNTSRYRRAFRRRSSLRERALRNNPTGLFPVSSCI